MKKYLYLITALAAVVFVSCATNQVSIIPETAWIGMEFIQE
jgi:hypothetical protein